DHLADMLELLRHSLIGGDDLVEGIGDLAGETDLVTRQPHREIADPHRLQRLQQDVQVGIGPVLNAIDCRIGGSTLRWANAGHPSRVIESAMSGSFTIPWHRRSPPVS